MEENNVHVVATGGLSPQYHLVKNVIESAKRVNRNIVAVVGGGIISADPETAMESLECVDFGVIGEGEVTMCELARALENGGDFSKVDGLIFKDCSCFKKTNPRKDIESIGTISWLDYEGFDIEKYLEIPLAHFAGINKNRMICMLGSRSCPYHCTFCCHTLGKNIACDHLMIFFCRT
ncbi:MAG: cobalamin-dependent protein [bacterium]|nr:cobalamin-dependent protein [bacterium]